MSAINDYFHYRLTCRLICDFHNESINGLIYKVTSSHCSFCPTKTQNSSFSVINNKEKQQMKRSIITIVIKSFSSDGLIDAALLSDFCLTISGHFTALSVPLW